MAKNKKTAHRRAMIALALALFTMGMKAVGATPTAAGARSRQAGVEQILAGRSGEHASDAP